MGEERTLTINLLRLQDTGLQNLVRALGQVKPCTIHETFFKEWERPALVNLMSRVSTVDKPA